MLGNDTLDARSPDGTTGAIDSPSCGPGFDGFAKDSPDTQVGCETALP